MNKISIEYEKLVEEYWSSLTTTLRGFSPAEKLDFLETWTPDDDVTYSILSIIECAYESELKELFISLDKKTLEEFNITNLKPLINNLATVNSKIIQEKYILHVKLQ